jgi:catechol 2,3-dioxygenase-like lactoylglutathione lyase family enzyme
MPLSNYHLNASIAVSDIQETVAFYEGKLGLPALKAGPECPHPRRQPHLRFWWRPGAECVPVGHRWEVTGDTRDLVRRRLDAMVGELSAAGVEFARYDDYEHDAKGVTARAGGGRIAWFQDPDGNTFAIEADA